MKVKYFGMIAEAIGLEEETWEIGGMDSNDFQEKLLKKYPVLKSYTFKIAVNHEIKSKHVMLCKTDEIAILPPFAGG